MNKLIILLLLLSINFSSSRANTSIDLEELICTSGNCDIKISLDKNSLLKKDSKIRFDLLINSENLNTEKDFFQIELSKLSREDEEKILKTSILLNKRNSKKKYYKIPFEIKQNQISDFFLVSLQDSNTLVTEYILDSKSLLEIDEQTINTEKQMIINSNDLAEFINNKLEVGIENNKIPGISVRKVDTENYKITLPRNSTENILIGNLNDIKNNDRLIEEDIEQKQIEEFIEPLKQFKQNLNPLKTDSIILRADKSGDELVEGSLEFDGENLYLVKPSGKNIIASNLNGKPNFVLNINDQSQNSSTPQVSNAISRKTNTGSNIDFSDELSFLNNDVNNDISLNYSNYKLGHKVRLQLNNSSNKFIRINFPSNSITDIDNELPNYFSNDRIIIDLLVLNDNTGQEVIYVKKINESTNLIDEADYIFSLRKLRDSYQGPAISIRRASDNHTRAINFLDNGELDTNTINNFCTGTDCTVFTWFNQSDTLKHATQATVTTEEPKIYDSVSGLINNSSGKVAILSDGVDDNLEFDLANIANKSFTAIGVIERLSGVNDNYFLTNRQASANKGLHLGFRDSDEIRFGQWFNDLDASITAFSSANLELQIFRSNLSIGKEIFRNSNLAASNGNTEAINPTILNQGRIFGAELASFKFDGTISEIIIFSKAITDNEKNILEEAINNYYSIY